MIDWKKGSGTAMYYMAMMWLIVLATLLFAEYFHTNSSIGKTQMFADILADGSAFIGNNGWGLEESEAKAAYTKLTSLNKNNFKDCEVGTIKFTNTDSNGKVQGYDSSLKDQKNKNNTTNATVKLKTKTLFTNSTLARTKTSSTRITYSGGLKIVLEAYKHSYEYNPASQTWYVWGGGHGGDDLAWENYADCSGFVSGVFRKCGYYIPSYSCTWDLEGCGTLVGTGISALDKARPGDIILIWWSGSGTSDHVAIYAGKKNGIHYMIHARGGSANSTIELAGKGATKGVHITQAAYSAANIMVRRIVNTEASAEDVQMKTLINGGLTRDEAVVAEGLKSAGYNNAQIAGVMGNLYQESQINPIASEAYENGLLGMSEETYAKKIRNGEIGMETWLQMGWKYTGYGLVQWSYTSDDHERKAGLWNYAKQLGSNVTDVYVQTMYMIKEMTDGSQSAFYDDAYFRTLTSSRDAAEYFCTEFERPEVPHMGTRMSMAKKYYNILQKSS